MERLLHVTKVKQAHLSIAPHVGSTTFAVHQVDRKITKAPNAMYLRRIIVALWPPSCCSFVCSWTKIVRCARKKLIGSGSSLRCR